MRNYIAECIAKIRTYLYKSLDCDRKTTDLAKDTFSPHNIFPVESGKDAARHSLMSDGLINIKNIGKQVPRHFAPEI